MRLIFFSVIIILFLSSCQKSEKGFTKELWSEKGEEDWLYPQRKFILKDLMDNYLKEGLTYKGIKELLGEPLNDNEWNYTMRYRIEEEYGLIDLVMTSTLNVYFTNDSIVKGFEVIEWER